MDRRAFVEFDPAARNAEIIRRVKAGETLASVAKDYYITRERARQIAVWEGKLCPTENMRQRNEKKRDATVTRLLSGCKAWREYQKHRDAIDAVMGEGFSPSVDARNGTVVVHGESSGARLRVLRPSRDRRTGKAGPLYWGIEISTTDRYLFATPDGRLFAVKPGTPIGKHIYVPLGGAVVKHRKEPMYVEITK